MARFQLQPGPVPLHHQVYVHLRAALDAGEWQIGDQLPPERELCHDYGCSLITTRRALDELVREGRLERTRGRGTFVRRPPILHDLTGTWSFSDEMRRRGVTPTTRLVSAATIPAPLSVAAALGLAGGARVHRIERVRLANGLPVMLERAHLPAARLPDLLDEDLETGSLYDALAARGVRLGEIRETIEPVTLGVVDRRLLETDERLALRIDGVTYTADGVAIEHTITHLPGDRSKIYLESRGARARALMPLGSPRPGPGSEPGAGPAKAAGRKAPGAAVRAKEEPA
jgi:GntR family transcriptional regulator